jgi:hypothetical protein
VALPARLYEGAVELLRVLSGPHGIHASSSATANYRAVFARDAVMAGVAGLLIEDAIIIDGLTRTLERLRALQGPEGQIASNYEIGDGQATKVSFGTLAPRIDAVTWYLIGVAMAARAGALDAGPFRDSVHAAVRLLDALEYNGRHLIYIPLGGNWADEYVYDGYILYDQVLRAWALRLTSATYDQPSWLEKSRQIERTIARRYWPSVDGIDRGKPVHPVASYSPAGVRDRFDLAACSLLALSRLVPEMGDAALTWIAETFLDGVKLPPAFHPVIDEAHADWAALQRYHLHGFRNRPHEYHNGGIWPIWLGWLALALACTGRRADLERLRTALHLRLARVTDYGFEEFFHGLTGVPGGTPQMAYTATGLVFLQVAEFPDGLSLLTA